jgi:hypothetical protein
MHDTTLKRLRSVSIFTSNENLSASGLISSDMDRIRSTTHAAVTLRGSPSNLDAELNTAGN